jgi:hypothetical protein
MSPTARLYSSVLLVGAWLGLLLFGVALGGAVHLVLAWALWMAPWRELLAWAPLGLTDGGDAAGAPPSRGGDDPPPAGS